MKMKITNQRYFSFLAVLLLILCFAACQNEYEQELGPRPTGSFTIEPLEGAPNTYLLISDVENAFRYRWNIGEGWYEGGRIDTAYFEVAGDYPVSMIAMTRNGHVVEERSLTVENNAPGVECAGAPEEVIVGCSDAQTWVLAGAGSLWVGPVDGSATWWALPANELELRACLLNDQFTFQSDGTFIFENNGDFWVEEEGGAAHPADIGLEVGCSPADAWPAQYQAWSSGTHQYEISQGRLTVIGTGAFLGMYKPGDEVGAAPAPEESITYDIIELTANRMVLEKVYEWGKWRFTFMPEGAEPEPEPEPTFATLPIDFETAETSFNTFGGSSFEIIENPDASGIYTSEKVAKTVHGDQPWAGLFVDLGEAVDMSKPFAIKVWAPAAGTLRFKMENRDNAEVEFIEQDFPIGTANEWVEIEMDLSGAPAGTYNRIVLFPGWDTTTADTYYFDDLRQL